MEYVFSGVLLAMGLFLILHSSYGWAKEHNKHWATMFLGLIIPVGLFLIDLMPERREKNDVRG